MRVYTLPGGKEVPVRGDDRDDASCPEQEPFSACLPECIRRFCPNLGLVPVYERILSHAAAQASLEK